MLREKGLTALRKLYINHSLPPNQQEKERGLGLSLSYNIIKAHGGVPIAIGIKVETKEAEGAEFIIQLPLNTNNIN